jgi:hypothetical protein
MLKINYKKHCIEKKITRLQETLFKKNWKMQPTAFLYLKKKFKNQIRNKTSIELLKQLKDSEVEIETLKQYIIDLKQRIAVYIPVRDDQVDKRLAEFINNYPER